MATADTTRLLVLGVTQIFEPANGYQLRRELLSWDVESWAHINPGSIYSMLSTLAKQELVERIDIVPASGARPVAVYRMTAKGRDELLGMVRTGIVEVRAFDSTELYAALSLAPTLLSRAEVLELLGRRVSNLEEAIGYSVSRTTAAEQSTGTPPHVARLMGYATAIVTAELEWMRGLQASLRAGELIFEGEDGMDAWIPDDADPAWRMVNERELYLQKLAQREP